MYQDDPDYQNPHPKIRKNNRRKKKDSQDTIKIQQDPDTQTLRYIKQLEMNLLSKTKILETNRKKYQIALQCFSKLLDNKGVSSDSIIKYIQSSQ